MLSNLHDSKLAASLRDGLKLGLQSVIFSHQKIVQLLSILESDDSGVWSTVNA